MPFSEGGEKESNKDFFHVFYVPQPLTGNILEVEIDGSWCKGVDDLGKRMQ